MPNIYVLTVVIPMCFSKLFKVYISVKHKYVFTNYAHSDKFRLKGVIIRLSIESHLRYIKYHCTFLDPKMCSST